MFQNRRGRLVVDRGLSCMCQPEVVTNLGVCNADAQTLILPIISFLTGVNAIEPSTSALLVSLALFDANEWSSEGYSSPKSVVRDSAASRKSLVGMALSLSA